MRACWLEDSAEAEGFWISVSEFVWLDRERRDPSWPVLYLCSRLHRGFCWAFAHVVPVYWKHNWAQEHPHGLIHCEGVPGPNRPSLFWRMRELGGISPTPNKMKVTFIDPFGIVFLFSCFINHDPCYWLNRNVWTRPKGGHQTKEPLFSSPPWPLIMVSGVTICDNWGLGVYSAERNCSRHTILHPNNLRKQLGACPCFGRTSD